MDKLKIENSIKKICDLNGKTGAYRNVAERFLPIGPQTEKEQNLNWDVVYKSIVENLFHLTCKNQGWEEIQTRLIDKIAEKRETKQLIDTLRKTYLEQDGFKKSTPLYYLICDDKAHARTKTMVNIFDSLFIFSDENPPITEGNNFLETLVNKSFISLCDKLVKDKTNNPYLPFLANAFNSDIKNLLSNTDYFLNQFNNFVELYSFLYLTQLTINLVEAKNRYEEPSPKPLYFILENEKVSQERHACQKMGYNYIFNKNKGLAWKIFPYLGYLELIFDAPIWQIDKKNSLLLKNINKLNESISRLFTELNHEPSDEIISAINQGLVNQYKIFENSERKSANEKVVNVFRDVFCRNFKTNRKKAGIHLVLKTNTVLLLTNLIIGNNKKILIDELLEGFKQRGIWFDLQSKAALLKMFENIGNIEKLSDSGDAVYVKRTI